MYILALALVLWSSMAWGQGLIETPVSSLPTNPPEGTTRLVVDGTTEVDCAVGGGGLNGSLRYTVLCTWSENEGAWIPGGGGGNTVTVPPSWPSDNIVKSLNWANSLANAQRIGDGVTQMCHYTDATLGPVIRPCVDSNVRTLVPPDFTWCLYDLEAGACGLTFDPDAPTPLQMYQFPVGYRPRKSIWFGAGSLSTDETQCAKPAEATPLASGVKLFTIICTDNDNARMHGSIQMPPDWDGGTLTFRATAQQTAASAGVIEYQVAGQCKGDTETFVTTANYGAEVVWTDTLTASSGAAISAVSNPVTFAGTCAAGDFVAFYIDIGATNTTTAMATTHIIGFNMFYLSTSLSH